MDLWKHQLAALEKSKGKKSFMYACGTGTGKSAILINKLREIYNAQGRITPTLILCPKIVVRQWKEEIEKFAPTIPKEKIIILKGLMGQKIKAFTTSDFNSIFITNYEALLSDNLYSLLFKTSFHVIVMDESHWLKGHTTKRTKQTMRLADKAMYKLQLTGTPILNSIIDIFSQFRILDQNIFGRNFFHFRTKYLYDANAGMPSHIHFPIWKLRPGALEEIKWKIEPLSFSASKEEVLDLPPVITQNRYFELSAEQARPYQELATDLVTYIDGATVSVNMALIKALRLYQITTGFLPLNDLEEGKFFEHNPRITALKDILEEHKEHGKIIVWCCYVNNYLQVKQACDDLEMKAVIASKDFTGEDPTFTLEKFKKDKDIRVLIANPQSSGTGVNLAEADIAIFYSRNYSLGNYLQALGRNIRGDSKAHGHSRILCINLIAEDTIDTVIQDAISNKGELNLSVLKAMKERILLPKKK